MVGVPARVMSLRHRARSHEREQSCERYPEPHGGGSYPRALRRCAASCGRLRHRGDARVESSRPMYREYPAPAPLASAVECFWRRELSDEDRGVVLPDGRVDLVWIAGGEPLVAGPQTRSVPRPPAPPGVALGVRFLPGAGPPPLGLPAHELVDLHVPLAAVDTAPAAALRRRLPELVEPHDLRSAVASTLARWLARADAPDRALRAAVGLLDAPAATVAGVARAVGYSERELRRRFR